MDFLEKSNHREEMNTTVAYASGSECSVLFPCLCFCLFRVLPWLILLLILPSVLIRGYAYSFAFQYQRIIIHRSLWLGLLFSAKNTIPS